MTTPTEARKRDRYEIGCCPERTVGWWPTKKAAQRFIRVLGNPAIKFEVKR